MLKELRIKNLAIIDDLTVRFAKGLNVLTGETGAGKSIVVDALGLSLGDRAQSDLVMSGESEAVVQAYFDLDNFDDLQDLGIDASDGLLLKRVISSGGKSRAYVNDSMVTLQTLSSVGKTLVDILSQHEHQSLLTQETQRTLLDSYGKLLPEKELVEKLYYEVHALKTRHAELRDKSRERAQRLDLLRFQLNEIESASLKPGEKESLEDERKILANMNKLTELTEAAYSALYESEGSCSERLSKVVSMLREMSAIDGSISEALQLVEAAMPLVEDASISLGRYRDRFDFEPGRLEHIEDRLDLIKKIERKYGQGIDAIMMHMDRVRAEFQEIESADENLASVEAELKIREEELLKAASALSEKRRKTAQKIEKLITLTLRELAFGKAAFSIEMKTEAVGPSGMDKIEFIFSANPGEPMKPLSKIISGGELSRVMLALKSILADVDDVPVLIFDEVDAGIGGKTAESVAKKLALISAGRQLLCITHLPQIASRGDFHLKIEKKETGNKVHVEVKELDGKERQDEIARMLSGTITEISRRHAEELLERVK
ncbi:DNA repair protein RecN [Candidatus Sulfobium mesophilum]|uniref:DNA repair protein RecN n=1 Tax=Candidatus Sulfobium mesophilum TaxID=2016548 RepID=A0A2U3QKX1_9BACT|nr:DNA repair protein RecN [Candidatus Sulfobium mesophilum]